MKDNSVRRSDGYVKSRQQVKAYWYNMQSAGQSVRLILGEMRAFSSLHLFLPGEPKPDTVDVTVMLKNGTCAYQRVFTLNGLSDTADYTVEQADDGTLHLVTRVETLPEEPCEILVHLTSQTGSTAHSIPCRYHRMHGRVTDFQGKPFHGFVMVNPDSFGESGVLAWTDERGHYELSLPERTYNSICVDDESYGVETLEAWAWHIILDQDQELDFKVGTGEVYGLTAWPSNGGFPVYLIHFRPMALQMLRPPGSSQAEMPEPAQTSCSLGGREFCVTELAPDLKVEDISVTVNSVRAEVLSAQQVLETGPDGQAMRSYLIQISRKGLRSAGKQSLYLEYRKLIEHNGEQHWVESMGYCQFTLTSKGLPE